MSQRQKLPAVALRLARKLFASRDLIIRDRVYQNVALGIKSFAGRENSDLVGSDELDELARARLSVNERNYGKLARTKLSMSSISRVLAHV